MHDSSRGRPRKNAGHDASRSASRSASRNASRNASGVVLFAVTLGFSAACNSDDDSPGTNTGGTGGQATGLADAGGPLRGEGFEPTPTFDISNPEREPPSREELIEGIGNLGGTGGSAASPAPADAGSTDGGDAS